MKFHNLIFDYERKNLLTLCDRYWPEKKSVAERVLTKREFDILKKTLETKARMFHVKQLAN